MMTTMIIKFKKSCKQDREHWEYFVVSSIEEISEEFLTLKRRTFFTKNGKTDNAAHGRRTFSIPKQIQ